MVFHRHSPYLTQSLEDRWCQPLAVMSPWLLFLRVRVLACVCDKQRKTLCTVLTPLLLTPDVWVSHTKQFNPQCTLTGCPTV